jgi:hypothetical protein
VVRLALGGLTGTKVEGEVAEHRSVFEKRGALSGR